MYYVVRKQCSFTTIKTKINIVTLLVDYPNKLLTYSCRLMRLGKRGLAKI